MKGLFQKAKGKVLVGAGLLMAGSSAFAATTHITQPTPDYTDFYATVGTVLGVVTVVMLAKRAKGFFR